MTSLSMKTTEQLTELMASLRALIAKSNAIDLRQDDREVWNAVYSANFSDKGVNDKSLSYQYSVASNYFMEMQRSKRIPRNKAASVENTIRLIENEIDVRVALELLDNNGLHKISSSE